MCHVHGPLAPFETHLEFAGWEECHIYTSTLINGDDSKPKCFVSAAACMGKPLSRLRRLELRDPSLASHQSAVRTLRPMDKWKEPVQGSARRVRTEVQDGRGGSGRVGIRLLQLFQLSIHFQVVRKPFQCSQRWGPEGPWVKEHVTMRIYNSSSRLVTTSVVQTSPEPDQN